jgi:putative acetyltransferase
MNIESLNPELPEAQKLIEASDEYMAALYPPESNHLESTQALKLPNVHFVGYRIDGQLVACGAVKMLDDDGVYGEIKRVFVVQQHRGRGISKAIIKHLESLLVQSGVNLARLETGINQPKALALYTKLGYIQRGPFGSYASDPLSIFMEKNLVA